MAVKHAVLGLLIEQADYGAGVERRFAERFPFWQGGSSIYSDLRWLRNKGYLRSYQRQEAQAEGSGAPAPHPASVWYEVTPAGREFFEAWLLKPLDGEVPALRSDLVMKVAFVVPAPEVLLQLYRDCVAQMRACTARMNVVAEGGDPVELGARVKDWSVVSGLLVREAETAHLQATKQYVDKVLRSVRRAYERVTGLQLPPLEV